MTHPTRQWAGTLSITAAAAEMGFHRYTIYKRANKRPEFSDALKKGKGVRPARLEREVLAIQDGPARHFATFTLRQGGGRYGTLHAPNDFQRLAERFWRLSARVE